jgi:monoamine oxidase
MRGYATRFGLTLENYHRAPGEVSYRFGGRAVREEEIVDEYRAFVPAMQDDLRTLGEPTARSFTEADEILDYTSLAEYLSIRGAGPLVTAALREAYEAEYGRAPEEQSALAMLFFLHADRRNRFQPFGVFSDEKYHVAEGNQSIAKALAAGLARPVQLGKRLVRVAKLSDGRIELTLQVGRRTERVIHDTVVITVPFSVLRGVELHSSLGVPAEKRWAIANYSYGTNAKMMIAFDGRPWAALGSNGSSYSDLANHQATWETNWTGSSPTQGVITDYASGERGARLDPTRVQREASAFLADVDRVWPGAAAVAKRERGNLVAHLEHWPSNPLSLGSYTNNAPGYFTTIADLEAEPVGPNLFFAGEHTSSFYEWQGFMEGACLSGISAAEQLLEDIQDGRL